METPGKSSVDQLLQRWRSGDPEAPAALFAFVNEESHSRSVLLGMARRLMAHRQEVRRLVDSSDLVQSAVRTGMLELEEFRGETSGEFYGWLRAIIQSKLGRAMRGASHHVPMPDSLAEGILDEHGPLPPEAIVVQETHEALMWCIRQLPPEQREVLELELQGFTSQEIAEVLGMKAPAVRKRSSRALAELRELFQRAPRGMRSDAPPGNTSPQLLH